MQFIRKHRRQLDEKERRESEQADRPANREPGERSGARCAETVGEHGHRVELESHQLEPAPCCGALLHASAPGWHASALGFHLLQPSRALRERRWFHRADARNFDGLDPTKAKRRQGQRPNSGAVVYEPINPDRRVHGGDEMRGATGEKGLVAAVDFAEGELGRQHAIKKTLEARRQHSPPCRENEDEMVRPFEKRLRVAESNGGRRSDPQSRDQAC